ncbi:hypothetical protein QFC22_000404 [Naganishia vaughanmartiniae]|uniref:Uncharacterized protein n=1 Tax=Naganishia vaughanmartiniae TaxID=1424756 RepID=A0ACC2XNL4_9TREE|nr:hypothetical protein QFC22_000404 [Naganishia vaughanmartiniae]
MKAIFSRLRSKESHEEKHKGKENNGPDNNVRKFAQGFSSLSRATGGKTLQPRQSSTLYTIEKQPPTTETARPSRPASANLLSFPYDTPIFNRSASLYVPADTTRPVTPVGDLVISSLENSLLHDPEQGNPSSSEHTSESRPSIAEHTTVPTKPTPTSDTDGTFTTSSTTTTAGKSFARRWLGRTSQGAITSENPKSKPLTTLNRKDSASSSLSSRFGSRSLSGALSPVSTRSRQSAVSGEDQEYCRSRQSWTGMAELDLVAHLGAQERTRQEVLFEIVSSEEKYVLDLIKMKETFIDKLIPLPAEERLSLLPYLLSKSWSRHSESTSSLTSPNQITSKFGSRSVSRADTTGDDLDRLPIAAHFTTSRSATPIGGLLPPSIIQYDLSESNQPSSPPRLKIYEGEEDLDATIRIKRTYHHLSRGQPSAEEPDVPVEDNVFAHKALPPLPLPAIPTRLPQDPAARERVSKRPISGQSLKPTISSESTNPPDRRSQRFSATRKRSSAGAWSGEMVDSYAITLPEDLRIVLEVTRGSILKGHIALSDALRKRYDDQYPLEYGKFVIHLERAIQQLDDCQGAFESNKKKLNDSDTNSLAAAGSAIQALNQTADDKGETGLAISLSKPFQRLLKYPLLFQNLLYNTDATLSEYDSCMTLLSEVDRIVRALEDEKADEDERERTRDTLARIEGLERDPLINIRLKFVSVKEWHSEKQDEPNNPSGNAK